MKIKNISIKRGVATLPIMLVVGMISFAIVISITSIAFNELLISQGSSQSSEALSYAEVGARDALIRITRNKNYTCNSTDCYTMDFTTNGCVDNTGCAKISVSSGIGSNDDPKVITSKGVMGLSIRQIQVVVKLDGGTSVASSQNGEITSAVWTELKN